MPCYNHPNATTTAICNRCEIQLCGMCTTYLDDGEYCESCAEKVQSEAFVAARSEVLNKPAPKPLIQEAADTEPTRAEKKEDQDKLFIWLGIGGSSFMMFAAMAIYAFPNLFVDDVVLAAQAEEQRLEDCRLVFEEITYILRAGGTPDASMSCADTSVPNVVRRSGDTVRVEHPNPGAYGLDEIYVTNQSHQVFLVGQGSSGSK